MRKIKDIISKPSQAVHAMIDGLKEQSQRKNFIIDMNTFGSRAGSICYGCAATCAVQKIAGKNLDATSIRPYWHGTKLGFDDVDIDVFESVIDVLRKGSYVPLFRYFEINYLYIVMPFFDLPRLTSNNWGTELHKYEQFATYLESIGL